MAKKIEPQNVEMPDPDVVGTAQEDFSPGGQLAFESMLENPAQLTEADEPAPVYEEDNDTPTQIMIFGDGSDLNTSDLLIPRLKLAQGLTTEVQDGNAKPGQYLVPGFDALDEVTIIPLGFTKRREYRDDEERNILCQSADAKVGVGTPGGACAVCPLSKWTGDKDSRRPPVCTFIYSYFVYVMEYETPAVLNFQRTAEKAGKQMNTFVMQRGLKRFAVTLGSASNKGKRGNFYTPTIKPAKITREQIDLAVESLSEMG